MNYSMSDKSTCNSWHLAITFNDCTRWYCCVHSGQPPLFKWHNILNINLSMRHSWPVHSPWLLKYYTSYSHQYQTRDERVYAIPLSQTAWTVLLSFLQAIKKKIKHETIIAQSYVNWLICFFSWGNKKTLGVFLSANFFFFFFLKEFNLDLKTENLCS